MKARAAPTSKVTGRGVEGSGSRTYGVGRQLLAYCPASFAKSPVGYQTEAATWRNACLTLRRTALSGKLAAKTDADITLTRETLDSILLKRKTFPDAIAASEIKVEGDPGKLGS
jgi:alkyl sulfatase BDS1-like metallo-beta-lactamase superfamily hydrolase